VFFISKGKTILEVLLDAGVNAEYSCEAGICGACEQRVISGIPEHRDSILTEDEQAANDRVMDLLRGLQERSVGPRSMRRPFCRARRCCLLALSSMAAGC
jgi:hypothetical protein